MPEIKQKIVLGFHVYSTKSRVQLSIDQGSSAFDRTNTERGYVTRIFLFKVNSVLKSLLRAFTHIQHAPVELERFSYDLEKWFP